MVELRSIVEVYILFINIINIFILILDQELLQKKFNSVNDNVSISLWSKWMSINSVRFLIANILVKYVTNYAKREVVECTVIILPKVISGNTSFLLLWDLF